jgi:N-acyl-D-aspartate/D-glutamate deacylase
MLDLLIKGATLIDGSGGGTITADVAVRDGLITEIGRISSEARETVNAEGAWIMPGFIDVHTHYDGQATWDETFSPSIHHGATTVVMGNCGVGFAPLRPGSQQALIELMEGVEDIPGVALAEGVKFAWESFPQYMDALDAGPHSLDYLVQVPHDPLRMFVMGERAVAHERASMDDIAAMRRLLREALQAGAAGFSTGRSDNHRTARGQDTPAAQASAQELTGIAEAFQGLNHGVVQVVSDFDLLRGEAHFEAEFDLIEQLAMASGRPLSMTWLQRDPGGEQYRQIQARVERAVAHGLPLYLQTAARGIGVIIGLDASFHPFMGFPAYREVAHLPLAERAAALRDPALKARLLAQQSVRLAGDKTPIPPLVDILLARIEMVAARMFALTEEPNYEPSINESFYLLARKRGVSALEAIYDHLTAGDGSGLIYFPIFNYNDGSLDVVRRMLTHPQALAGLSDAGAHAGTICDASFSTFMLSYWVQERNHGRLGLERVVEMLSSRNARYLGLKDRGLLKPGLRADINLIDPQTLGLAQPRLVHDMPGATKRLLQASRGYLGTWVAGRCVVRDGEITAERPGRLVRMG